MRLCRQSSLECSSSRSRVNHTLSIQCPGRSTGTALSRAAIKVSWRLCVAQSIASGPLRSEKFWLAICITLEEFSQSAICHALKNLFTRGVAVKQMIVAIWSHLNMSSKCQFGLEL